MGAQSHHHEVPFLFGNRVRAVIESWFLIRTVSVVHKVFSQQCRPGYELEFDLYAERAKFLFY